MSTSEGVTKITWSKLFSVLKTLDRLRYGKLIPIISNNPEDIYAIELIIDKGYDIEIGFSISFSDDYQTLNKGRLTGFGKMEGGLWVEKKLFQC